MLPFFSWMLVVFQIIISNIRSSDLFFNFLPWVKFLCRYLFYRTAAEMSRKDAVNCFVGLSDVKSVA